MNARQLKEKQIIEQVVGRQLESARVFTNGNDRLCRGNTRGLRRTGHGCAGRPHGCASRPRANSRTDSRWPDTRRGAQSYAKSRLRDIGSAQVHIWSPAQRLPNVLECVGIHRCECRSRRGFSGIVGACRSHPLEIRLEARSTVSQRARMHGGGM